MTTTTRLQDEAEGDGSTVVPLGSYEITVPPVEQWRSSALHALTAGDFETWAQRTLDAEGYAAWQDVDPTVSEIEAFLTAWGEQTGTSVGGSKASPTRSRRTARR